MRQPLKVELAAHFGIGAASVRNVVGVKRHHVRENVRLALVVYEQK